MAAEAGSDKAKIPRICVIGAGPSGIAAGRALLAAGLSDIAIYEQGDSVGGNWVFDPRPGHSSVYETAHAISSRRLSEYGEFPMPADYPDYPSHKQLRRYFASYADHFGVTTLIRFNTTVNSVVPLQDGGWRVSASGPAGHSVEAFDFLLVANGHHWDPRMPTYPGKFTGDLLHSHAYKSAASFAGKRVLVIGGGNSACDIAVEISRSAHCTCISMRRGYYFFPKIIFGRPVDVAFQRSHFLPRRLDQWCAKLALNVIQGSNRRYGLEEPDHEPLEYHPNLNSELLYAIRHGRVHPHRDVSRFDGPLVQFIDGRVETFDAVIAATGYKITFPFFDRSLVDFSEAAAPPLYLNVFHPRYKSLYFIGLVQPIGCIWPLAELQAKIVAEEIGGRWSRPSDIEARIRRQIDQPPYRWANSLRHGIEVDYHRYRRQLEQELKRAA
jgi:hypothetical protein